MRLKLHSEPCTVQYSIANAKLWSRSSDLLYCCHRYNPLCLSCAAVALSPHDGGRYLMTCSFDRTTKYWDLENTSAPITVNKRGSVTDGVWLTHWVSAVSSLDDSYS
jgi:WD40 repeat protein